MLKVHLMVILLTDFLLLYKKEINLVNSETTLNMRQNTPQISFLNLEASRDAPVRRHLNVVPFATTKNGTKYTTGGKRLSERHIYEQISVVIELHTSWNGKQKKIIGGCINACLICALRRMAAAKRRPPLTCRWYTDCRRWIAGFPEHRARILCKTSILPSVDNKQNVFKCRADCV